MILRAIGTSSSMTVPDRNNSCLMLQTDNTKILLDMGDGTAQQLVKFGIDPWEIDAGVISHAHIDHSAGIFGILFWMKLADRKKDFTIYAPEYLSDALQKFLPFMRIRRETLPFKLIFLPLRSGTFFENSSLCMTAAGNNHLNPEKEAEKFKDEFYSFSIIITEQGKKVIYTSDVQTLDPLGDHAFKCSLLISEVAHIPMETVMSFAEENDIRKIAITHIPPDFDAENIPAVYNRQVLILNDGDILRI